MRKILVSTILGVGIAGTANASIVSSGFLDEKLTEMTNATTLQLDNKANQSDLTALSNKIGTLPSAILPNAWTAIPYYTENNVNMPDAGILLPPTLGEQLEFLFNGGPGSPIERMFMAITMLGGNVNTDDNPSADFLGLHPLTQKVRSIEENITLPDGLTVANLYDGWTDSDGYRVLGLRIIEDKNFVTYNPRTGQSNETTDTLMRGLLGMLDQLFSSHGYDFGDEVLAPFWYLTQQSIRVGEIPHGKTAAGMIDEINTKIGTLPSGNFHDFPGDSVLFPWLNQPHTYPTSLAELITAIYGETNSVGLLAAIIAGYPLDINGDNIPESNVGLIPNYELANANATKIGTVPDGKNLAGMIGTLPDGYDSVGAALTAIKGIAEDAKAAALAAIPDPKQEGSSGKFVLTVDIVGDNATYRWEKIDREGETTTTE